MGFLKRLLIETKVFVLLVEGGNYFHIIERSRKATKEMVSSHVSACWLTNIVEKCSISVGMNDFYKTYHNGTKALFWS